MKSILKDKYIDYLVQLKSNAHPDLTVDKGSVVIRVETTEQQHFDLVDKQESIIVGLGKGSATYNNPTNKVVEVIDYEDLINQLPSECNKDIKRADFILYHENGTDFFIINELSQSRNASNKRNKAILQLSDTVKHLLASVDTKVFIDKFDRKICIFSNKDRLIPVSDNPAKAFEAIKEYLPDPVPIKFQPITKAGFEAVETSTFEV